MLAVQRSEDETGEASTTSKALANGEQTCEADALRSGK
jgi:hypothetical protein